ncbi:Nn.00g090790.m01.CDS01 [Neocucurbitaria sp. VM-36]
MLELYGGYCATANVETEDAPKSTPAVTTTAGGTLMETGTGLREGLGGTPTETDVFSTKITESGGESDEDEGLSKSDIIALATGLGVGVPSLVVGVLALWFQLRKKRDKPQSDIMIAMTPSHSRTHILPAPPPPARGYGQNQVYELRGWG